jgi:hypothetical protein
MNARSGRYKSLDVWALHCFVGALPASFAWDCQTPIFLYPAMQWHRARNASQKYPSILHNTMTFGEAWLTV